jgi:phosphoglucosamine mutase
MGKYFGTDGIRGVYEENLTLELAYKLGVSIAQCLAPKTLVIGMDTRSSSETLAHAVIEGYKTFSDHIIFAGVCSTPMIAHYAKMKNITGVMITASHNPYQYNGIKVFNKGFKLTADEEMLIEERMSTVIYREKAFKKYKISEDVKNAYLKVYEDLNLNQADLNVGLDCANGATYQVAFQILIDIVKDLTVIGNNPDGYNINKGYGSTSPEALIELVKEKGLDIGFAFDGDGDRIFVVDREGNIYDGDLLVYVIASYLKDKNELNHDTVVLTKMSNPGLLKALKDMGIMYILTDVGDKYVAEALMKEGLSVGGESSGHLIMPKLLHSGDGLLIATLILKILNETHKTLKELTSDVILYPLKLVNLKDMDKSILDEPEIIASIEGIKESLGKESLCLIRPSGTEPLIRITISHQDEDVMNDAIHQMIKLLKKEVII